CVTAQAESRTPADLLDGLREWSAVPGRDAQAEMRDDVIELRVCDPGPDGPEVPDRDIEIVTVPASRTFAYSGVRAAGADQDVSRCGGEGVIDALTIDELTSGESAEVDNKMIELMQSCVN